MTDAEREPEGGGGLTLDEAWKKHVSQELRTRFLVAKSLCPPPWDDDKIAMQEGDEWYLDSFRARAFEAFKNAWAAVWDDLTKQLSSARLVGFVFNQQTIGLDTARRRVPAGHWRRAIYLAGDVEIFGVLYRDARIWRAMDMEASRPQPNNSSGKAAADCAAWLRGRVAAGAPAKVKDKYRAEAMDKFPGLSGRAFNDAWKIETAGCDDWGKPGRKKK